MLDYRQMTEVEIAEAVKQFKKCIDAEALSVDRSHADPVKEYCYISTGSVPGVYFPNSIITYKRNDHKLYNFCCISKTDEGLGVVLALDEDRVPIDHPLRAHISEYIFITFEKIYYTYEEAETIAALRKRITEAQNELRVLCAIKFITKKDGQPFTSLFKNIDEAPAPGQRVICCAEYSSIRVTLSEKKTSAAGVIYNDYLHINLYNIKTVDDFREQVRKTIETRAEEVERYEAEIRNIKKIYKLVYNFNNAIKNYNLSHAIKNQIERFILK